MSTGYPLLDELQRLRGQVITQAAEIERLRNVPTAPAPGREALLETVAWAICVSQDTPNNRCRVPCGGCTIEARAVIAALNKLKALR